MVFPKDCKRCGVRVIPWSAELSKRKIRRVCKKCYRGNAKVVFPARDISEVFKREMCKVQ